MTLAIYNLKNAVHRDKMAAFDYDWTLVSPTGGKTFLSDEKQIVIMMGYPGSGKSSIAKIICKNESFVYIEGDLYKTSTKMIGASLEHISKNKSIVFDATNSSSKKRQEYIELGKKYNYKIVCIHVSTPLEVAYKRNKLRNYERYVPKIAYSVYKKNYDEPNETEGFKLFVIYTDENLSVTLPLNTIRILCGLQCSKV